MFHKVTLVCSSNPVPLRAEAEQDAIVYRAKHYKPPHCAQRDPNRDLIFIPPVLFVWTGDVYHSTVTL